ncbi:hypothetical protein HMJ29_17215 [Hymenobacter taeanensis]|uniref:DUF3192 domain-containing protein n=1 Tax=Hymenobacter taeanensis TaxID=2735321 RepID=A0A6M6BM96_9BACT|nr:MULTISPECIES: hypothetical protein [Hymenobacter]QJX48563.1 hypothetical protein HMJ29_17215 [Hymenobacter taeanensis]UOQ81941.1 hypothetical protein MUN83_03895 [Hymenobacter sp. 5414T-23]
MASRFTFLALLTSLALTGCGHALPDYPDFNAAAWRKDPYGCANKRQTLLPALEKHRDELFGARIGEIDALLGHPDEEELSEQSEKVYIYYITQGPQCVATHPRANGPRLILRFGATGALTESLFPVSSTR